MGYQTGTSTGPNDLIDKLRLFLIDEGWTVNLFTTVGAGYRLHVQKALSSGEPDMYFNFRSAIAEYGTTLITGDNYGSASYDITGILVNGSTGYSAGQLWHQQPGYPMNGAGVSYACAMTPMSVSAIPAYYFFAVGDSIHICVEVTAGKFQFMSFGCLVKQGIYTGGRYFTASISSMFGKLDWTGSAPGQQYAPRYFSLSGYAGGDAVQGAVYVDVDGTASWRRCSETALHQIAFSCPSCQNPVGGGYDTYSLRSFGSMFYTKAPNFYNNIATMCPAYVFVKRSDLNYSLLGWPEGVRSLNVLNYTAGQELTYGTETWKVFEDDGILSEPNNPYAGFAFLKVV